MQMYTYNIFSIIYPKYRETQVPFNASVHFSSVAQSCLILCDPMNRSTPGHPATAAKSLQSCPTLCDPRDGSPPDSTIPGILQARTLEWAAISFSSAGKWKVKVKSLSHVHLLTSPWTVAFQASPSMGFSRQEYWSGVPLPSPSQWLRCPQSKVLCYIWCPYSHW